MLTNSSGNSTGAFTCEAYGSPAGSAGTQTTPLGYAGQYTNAESGLQYLRARVYDPDTGQFLTRDPLIDLTGSPYGYANQSPLNSSDPTGLISLEDVLNGAWNGTKSAAEFLDPLKHYEDEVNTWKNGGSYWDSVKHGVLGACVNAGQVVAGGLTGPRSSVHPV